MRKILVILAFLCLTACDNIEIDDVKREELVVEGWIEDGHAPIVFVHSTLPITSTPQPLDTVTSHILRYATVYIDTDSGRHYLTASLSKKHLVANYFTSSTLRGEAGKTYRLGVEWQDLKASAVCTIPETTLIDTSYFERNPERSGYTMKIEFINNPAAKRCYALFNRFGDAVENNFILDRFSLVKGENALERITQTVLPNNGTAYNHEKDMYFHIGDTVAVRLVTMDESMFDFWTNYSNSVGTMTSLIPIPYTSNILGNVVGGIGYWAGYGSDTVERICD